MDETGAERIARNRMQQVTIYGAAMGEIVAGLLATYGTSQAALAKVLGVSAPMLSQVAGAHRVKLGNPAAVQRLQHLLVLAEEVDAARTTPEAALQQVADQSPGQVLTRTTERIVRRDPDVILQQAVRALGSRAELLDAARRLSDSHPAIAEFLRAHAP